MIVEEISIDTYMNMDTNGASSDLWSAECRRLAEHGTEHNIDKGHKNIQSVHTVCFAGTFFYI